MVQRPRGGGGEGKDNCKKKMEGKEKEKMKQTVGSKESSLFHLSIKNKEK